MNIVAPHPLFIKITTPSGGHMYILAGSPRWTCSK